VIYFEFVKVRKMVEASQDESEATFEFIEEVLALWDVSSVAFKDMETTKGNREASGQTGFGPNLSISQPLCFFSSLLLFHCSV